MPAGYYWYPTIHNDTIIFVSEDDLWTVSACGGMARRLTANLGSVTAPALSPDGALLAFTGYEEGQPEVYTMPSMGGPATRLTYLGSRTHVIGWRPDGQAIIFASDSGQPFYGHHYLYQISATGGQPQRLPTGPAKSISFGPNGGRVIARNTTDLAHWKRYQGGLTGDLWIDRKGDGDWRRLIKLNGNLALPLWVGERIYFVSDHEGIGNLYSCLPNGEDLRRHTAHNDFYARHPATDGRRIIYHAGADLYLFDPALNKTQMIEPEFHSPRVQRNRRFVDAEEFLHNYDLHPGGYGMVITSRGKPFVMALWEKAVVQQGELQGVRYRLATWLQDSIRLAIISDAGGEEALELHFADASNKPVRLNELDLGRVTGIKASPTKNMVAITNHRNELLIVDVDEKTARVLDRSRFRPIYSVAWSPDGRWLAYTYWNARQTSIIKLANVKSAETWEVTRPVLRDTSPAFDPDGRYLYFLSYRDFDPVYDNVHFDLSFPWGVRPYLITLQADLPSPFLPVPRPPGEKMPRNGNSKNNAPEESDSQQNGEEKSPDEPAKEEDRLQIDLEGITNRVIAFPVSDSRYGQIRGINGKVLFTSYPITGSAGRSSWPNATPSALGRLEVYDLETQQHDTLLRGITEFEVSMDYRTLIYQSGKSLRVLKAGEKPDENSRAPSRKSGWLDLDRIKVLVEPQAEWEQMYREAWRLQRDYFWTEDMSEVDWETIYKRYLPLVNRVSSRSEFSDLLTEMQGELATSHAYEYGGDYRPEPDYRQGFLGANLHYDAHSDSYRIESIVQGDAWSWRRSSPLAQAGLDIKPGDRIIAVNRRKVSEMLSPQALLVNQAGEEVLLTVVGQEDGAEPRTVSVKTLHNERPVRYRAWVEANRQRVHQATDGRVGYVHIPDMGPDGYAEFHRGYLAEVEREGLIIDVRFNGGGHVSSLILEKLARRRLGYDVSRWGEPIPYPRESIMGPMVAITNERTASDGDMFSHAFKLMKLGKLIGTRTWGGVIGYTNNGLLVDGGQTTQPQFSAWFEEGGWGLENYGTEPDIEVEIRPQDYIAGQDPQLERAVTEILAQLSEDPPRLPDFGERPRRSLPTLPVDE